MEHGNKRANADLRPVRIMRVRVRDGFAPIADRERAERIGQGLQIRADLDDVPAIKLPDFLDQFFHFWKIVLKRAKRPRRRERRKRGRG